METPMLSNGDSNSTHQVQIGTGSLFGRKIDFHLARKPYSGVVNFDDKFRLETLNPSAVNGSADREAKTGDRVRVDTSEGVSLVKRGFDDPELSFGITFKRIGAGLENLGNTCFLNSVLQCLTYTEPLVAYLQSGRHQSSCQIAGFCALCAIQKHVSRALHATGRSLAPKDLVSNLRCISRTFRNARQEDAHEYMVQLLESMHKCCLPKGVPSESPSAYEKSLVHKIFGGRLQSQVRCMQCSHCSNKYDPFLDLSLEIAKADTLQKALGHFTAKEQLDDGAKQYQCQQCKQKVRAVKQLTVHEAPYVLTIHLKRFSALDPRQKIDKKVAFGPKLELKPFVSGSHEGSLMYTLYGVLVHAGWSTRSGHYYCFVRTSTGMWYSLDDNRVVQVNERTVLDQKAYMLFYVRDRKISAQKKPCNVTLKERMSSCENTMLLTLTKGLKGVGQNGSFEKHGGEHSDIVTKVDIDLKTETKKEEKSGINSLKPADCAALKTTLSNLNGAPQNGNKTANCRKVVESLPPINSCDAFDGLLGNGTVTSNKEYSLKKDAFITANKNAVMSEKPPQAVDDACSLGQNVTSEREVPTIKVEVPTVKADATLTPDIPSNLPISSTNDMLKPKKNLSKPFFVTMRLSTNVICASSGRFRMKKHTKSRKSFSKSQICTQKILENTVSTSGSASIADTPIHKKKQSPSKKKTVDPVKEELHYGNTQLNTESECEPNANSADAMVLACESLRRVSDDKIRDGDDKHRGNSGVKRGLEEPIVARWDGTLSAAEELVSLTCESARIGYVPDEWDEEYDRGKRKKVKTLKDSYDGVNPFQEFATSKATSRKSKKDRLSSANRPYRIL